MRLHHPTQRQNNFLTRLNPFAFISVLFNKLRADMYEVDEVENALHNVPAYKYFLELEWGTNPREHYIVKITFDAVSKPPPCRKFEDSSNPHD